MWKRSSSREPEPFAGDLGIRAKIRSIGPEAIEGHSSGVAFFRSSIPKTIPEGLD